jgi:hypothetical protein
MQDRKKRPLRGGYSFSSVIADPSLRLTLFVNLLNSRDSDEGLDSIRDLLRNLKAVEGMARKKHFPKSHRGYVQNLFTSSDAQLRARGLAEETINRMKKIRDVFERSRFKLTPGLFPNHQWEFVLVPRWTGTVVALGLNFLLAIIQGLNATDLLSSVRECELCKRWYIASRANVQRFCTPACRKKVYAKSGEGKKKRKKYMRRYRADQKRRVDAEIKRARTG